MTKSLISYLSSEAGIPQKYRNSIPSDFHDHSEIGIPWDDAAAFKAWIREYPIISINGDGGSGKTLLASMLMMRCMAVFQNPWSMPGNYYYEKSTEFEYEEFRTSQFIVVDNLERNHNATLYANAIADREEAGRFTILASRNDWASANLQARVNETRVLRLV